MLQSRAMRITEIDPRDSRWERTSPRYRVELRRPDTTETTYEFIDGDVVHVLQWLEKRPDDTSFILYVTCEDDTQGLGLIALATGEPTGTS